MDVGANSETITGIGGAVGFLSMIKMIYNDYVLRQDKLDIFKRLDQQDEEIATHTILDAQTFVTKSEHANMMNHIDSQFSETRKLIIDLIRHGNGSD